MESAALRAPDAVGVNVTLIWQDPPVPRVVPQELVSAKSPAFTPVIPIELIVRVELPALLRVTSCGEVVPPTVWVLRLTLKGLSCTAACVPVPESATLCGLPGALSVTARDALRTPVAVGAKVMWI
jgi:hypothetical protein